MPTLVAQIAPQRSTQYAALADALAPQELRLCPLGDQVSELRQLTLGGQAYLQFDLPSVPDKGQLVELGMLATLSGFHLFYERLGGVDGPLLRPLETGFSPALPPELVMARRYRGKTNEMFTHFLCNVARFSSALAARPWNTLRVFDPLSGGGTTLFAALVLGASVAGVERNARDVETTAAYLRQFTREQGIACRERKERFKQIGRRWVFALGKGASQQDCMLACGDTADSAALISGFRPHLIVTDLPYGIQHRGELADLLAKALPVWADLLPPSGTLALAWESRRFPRSEMIELVESISPLAVLNEPPYDGLAHRVDRVIKERDVLVARLAEAIRD
jgi:hypothetical protein